MLDTTMKRNQIALMPSHRLCSPTHPYVNKPQHIMALAEQ